MIALYVHIPFCRTLCPYCDFVRTPCAGPVPDAFVDALCAEVERFEGASEADTLFLGGGTPSLLAPAQLERVFAAVQGRFALHAPEISVEANPDDLTVELADAWKSLGVNRVSLGVQSFDDEVLRYLGRRHDAAAARRACALVAECFENWSIDLMFGAPPLESWEASLRECAALAPPHVSTYGLTYEDSTPFGARSGDAVDDEAYLRLYRQAEEILGEQGQSRLASLAGDSPKLGSPVDDETSRNVEEASSLFTPVASPDAARCRVYEDRPSRPVILTGVGTDPSQGFAAPGGGPTRSPSSEQTGASSSANRPSIRSEDERKSGTFAHSAKVDPSEKPGLTPASPPKACPPMAGGRDGSVPSVFRGPHPLERYEISNFARPGFECRHNLRYWQNLEYAGFGPGAYSFLDDVRARNEVETNTYLEHPGRKVESIALSDAEIRLETLIQHFRLKTGLAEETYAQRFGRSLRDDFGDTLDGLVERGLLEHAGGAYHPTALGFELNNEIGLALVG